MAMPFALVSSPKNVTSPDYSRLVAIEARALRSEAMGLCLGAARKLDVWSDHLGAM
jgi:hypothetical protein